MCGIAGLARLGADTPDQGVLLDMCAALEHRGPDSRGTHIDGDVGLGIQRLRVIDLATGDQPVHNEDGSVAVVLNGEIYNYRELRSALLARGHHFTTESDTEVIAHLYEDEGASCVNRLVGMFAFAVWDAPRRRLTLARDRVGKKPLFYCAHDDRLSFASELGSLMRDPEIPRELDLRALDAYLGLRYIPSPLSAYRSVRKLPPATVATFDPDGLQLHRYWGLDFGPKLGGDDEEQVERLRESLRVAVERRMIADVPLGAFLSGGIDSAAVVAVMAEVSSGPVKTFSIGFEDPRLDEREPARLTARTFGTEHHELVVVPDAVEMIPKIIRHHGEPFADATALPTFYLAEMARQHVTVALNGDGGDETFGGYTRYEANLAAGRLERIPSGLRAAVAAAALKIPPSGRIDSTASRIRRAAYTLAMSPPDRYISYMTTLQGFDRDLVYTPEFREQIGAPRAEDALKELWSNSTADELLDRMLDLDTQTYLPDDLLGKVDIATMAASLEGRSPLLDHEFMELAAALPTHLKISRGEKKVGLKRAFRGILPDEILDAPKRGFQPPLAFWFRSNLQEMAREVLLDPGARDRCYFDTTKVEAILEDHIRERADNSQAIWTMLIFELWHQEFVD